MIIELNEQSYEYDVHSLVKAFFPGQNVKLSGTAKAFAGEEGEGQLTISIKERGADFSFCPPKEEGTDFSYCPPKERGADFSYCPPKERGADFSFCPPKERGTDFSFCPPKQEDKGEITVTWEYHKEDGRYKDAFKRALYLFLSGITGKELPWGNLTGIRPTKIAYGLLEEGAEDARILQYYKDIHYVSEEKSRLSLGIAKRERELLSKLHFKEGYSLYIGIPFCPSTCLYCSFTSFPICAYEKKVDRYLECLIAEMEYVAEAFRDKKLDTVYIGGGTPTTLTAERLDHLLGKLRELFDFSGVLEFTVEAGRADSITREKLEILKKWGVQRISVNPQTMKQETLDIIGRKASVKQVKEAYALAKEIGFDNINMDLILGLPGETVEDVQNTIEEVVRMNPDSLTVHSLAIKRASRLNQWITEHGIEALKNTDETMEIARKGAERLAMEPYYLYRQKNMSGNFENVGYAKEGKYGIYNILIMEEVQTIVALGAGSITKRVFPVGPGDGACGSSARIERCDNVKDVNLYMEQIDEMIERKRRLFKDFDF